MEAATGFISYVSDYAHARHMLIWPLVILQTLMAEAGDAGDVCIIPTALYMVVPSGRREESGSGTNLHEIIFAVWVPGHNQGLFHSDLAH